MNEFKFIHYLFFTGNHQNLMTEKTESTYGIKSPKGFPREYSGSGIITLREQSESGIMNIPHGQPARPGISNIMS